MTRRPLDVEPPASHWYPPEPPPTLRELVWGWVGFALLAAVGIGFWFLVWWLVCRARGL